ncbi:MAG: LytTR family DNA-binding domain-containing protein [Gammaproteobacteria bacterium]|nr:LytTR family DNA-binding domain-containing protein [Gammaproteobacteria bacterium]MDH5799988.1 LytTR family DNA-binding domain-containing protein [Gammaproteobacteria bacterium]
MNILIADDEPLARSRLKRIVEEMDHTIVGEAADGKEVLLKSGELRPDLIFLDIRMPGMDGLETAMHLSNLDNPPAIIFTTAFSEHALAAFDAEAVDYLLKPIRRERLEQALSRVRKINRAQLVELGKSDATDHSRTHLSAQISGNIKLVPIEDIFYFQADQKYVTVRYRNGEVIIDESLKSLEEEFGERFVRIHRNALVAKAFMQGLERTAGGSWVIKMREIDNALEVSRRHMTQVRKMLKEARLR